MKYVNNLKYMVSMKHVTHNKYDACMHYLTSMKCVTLMKYLICVNHITFCEISDPHELPEFCDVLSRVK